MLRILFMGTPDFARESLEEVYNAENRLLVWRDDDYE